MNIVKILIVSDEQKDNIYLETDLEPPLPIIDVQTGEMVKVSFSATFNAGHAKNWAEKNFPGIPVEQKFRSIWDD